MSELRGRAVGASLAAASIVAVFSLEPTKAAEVPTRIAGSASAYAQTYDWTGFYLGGHVGYGRGTWPAPCLTLMRGPLPVRWAASLSVCKVATILYSPSRAFVGIEGDMSFANFTRIPDRLTLHQPQQRNGRHRLHRTGTWTPGLRIRSLADLRDGRFFLVAVARSGVSGLCDEDKVLSTRTGWVVGGGAELAIATRSGARASNISTIGSAAISATFSIGRPIRVRLQPADPATWVEPQSSARPGKVRRSPTCRMHGQSLPTIGTCMAK